MHITNPPNLVEGDTIRIVATARKIDREIVDESRQFLERHGFTVEYGNNLFKEDDQFAGSDEKRAADFNDAIKAPHVKAILCVRGGYGSVRILDLIDWESFMKAPKWVAGYSDVTAIHLKLNRLGIASLHSTMPVNFKSNSEAAIQSLADVLKGVRRNYEWNSGWLRIGETSAEIIGGNVSMIYSMMGSPEQIQTSGKILFLEDLDEYLYHVDRMMQNFKRAGILDNLAGLIVGGLSDMNDNTIPFGKDARQIIQETVDEYEFPVAFDFPAGHIYDNRAIVFGQEAKLVVKKDLCTFTQV